MGFLSNLFGKRYISSTVNQIVDEPSGSTKLHIACSQGDVKEVLHLLAQGADVNITNKWGATALDLAYSNGANGSQRQIFVEIAKLLKAKGGISKTWKGVTF